MSKDATRNRSRTRILNSMKSKTILKCVSEVARSFQLLVRLGKADAAGNVVCCTCGKAGHYKAFDAGHFISRSHAATVFDERNCHPQCKHDNRYKSGASAEYAAFMVDKYGPEVVEELQALSRTVKQWTREELAEMKLEFNEEIRALERGIHG